MKGKKVVSIEYSLYNIGKKYREKIDDDEQIVSKVKDKCYGGLLPSADVGNSIVIPFNPIEEIRTALINGGYYPTIKVKAEMLPPPPPPPKINKEGYLEQRREAEGDDGESDESEGDESDDESGSGER